MRATATHRTHTANLVEHLLFSLLIGFILFLVAGAAALIGFQLWNAGSIYPGVRVAGMDLGGLTSTDAVVRVTGEFQFPQKGTILFQDGNRTWKVSPAEIGLFFDPQATVRRAYAVGRGGNPFKRLQQQLETAYYGVDLSPAFVFDQRIAYNYLSSLAREIDLPMREAVLGLQNGEITATSGQVGRKMDIDATLAALSTQMQTLQDGVVPLVITETPPEIMDASAQAELARGILSRPLTLTLPEGQEGDKTSWTIKPEILAGLLAIERASVDGKPGYKVGLNPTLLRSYLGTIAPEIDVVPQNARFIFNDDTHKLDVLEKSITGRNLDLEKSITAIQDQVTAGKHSVKLALSFTSPDVEDTASGEDLGITELVHSETSWYYGSSAERVQNIQAAASKFHGLLVPPGATFSMAAALGNISLDNGYAEAMIIVGGQTVKGVGGGVCQVSTTLFRAAFFAGFPVIERHPHAYRVYYYEKVAGNSIDPSLAGLDATVFVPLVDFKFRNDTPYWLLMETYVNPQTSSIQWKFYSTKDGRSVDWTTTGPINQVEPPEAEYHENPDLEQGEIKQVDWQAQGADVTVNRTVSKDGGIYFQDTFNTHYEAWADVYEYGPGTELPSEENGDEEEE